MLRPPWELDGSVLRWLPAGNACYELRAERGAYARLRMGFGSAVAEAGDCQWTFAPAYAHRTRLRLHHGSEADVATLVTVSAHDARLEFCDGQVYWWRCLIFGSQDRACFAAEGRRLLHSSFGLGPSGPSGRLEIERGALVLPHLLLLALVGWYEQVSSYDPVAVAGQHLPRLSPEGTTRPAGAR